jgi:Zn-dependent peptidase ImmA (M78 family)
LDANKLDAFSTWDDYTGRPLLVLSEDKQSAVRSRLDAAHELAHLVLHRNVPKELLLHKPTFDAMEQQANRFAGAFLLPARTFTRDFALPTLNALKALKLKWKVSIGLMIKRAAELELISEEQATRLWVNRSRQKWSKREPYDDEMEPEQPVLLARSIRLLVESDVLSPAEIRDEMALPTDDIETLAGLPLGYLSQPVGESVDPEPRLLRFPKKTG